MGLDMVLVEMPEEFTLQEFIAAVSRKYKITVGSYLRGISISAYRNFYYCLADHPELEAVINEEQLFKKL